MYIQPTRKPLVKRWPAGRCQPVSSSSCDTTADGGVAAAGSCATGSCVTAAGAGTVGCTLHGSVHGGGVGGADCAYAVEIASRENMGASKMAFMTRLLS